MFGGLFCIIGASGRILYPEKETIMRPTELRTDYIPVGEAEIELTHLPEIAFV